MFRQLLCFVSVCAALDVQDWISMKKVCIIVFVAILAAAGVACTSPDHRGKNPDVAGIDLPLRQREQVVGLSEVADSLRYIPLETTDSCLIGSVDKLLLTEAGRFVVVDKEIAASVYVFDADGRFLNRIGRHGQGPGEYNSIEDVTCGGGYIYVWDSSLNKVLKFTEHGGPAGEFRFGYTAYAVHCLGEDRFAFCCDYAPNRSLERDGRYPSLLVYDAASGELDTGLYFDGEVDYAGYLSALNNLVDGNLYLPLNDTLYAVDRSGVSVKYVLRYADRYREAKEAFVERSRTEPMAADVAEEAYLEGRYPHLLTWLACDSVSLLFMRMQDYLYYGFYYPHTGIYKEASSSRGWPVANDLDGCFVFSPRCVRGNRAYCVANPAAFLKNGNPPFRVSLDDNPVLVEVFMKPG